ncbi:MAG: hypothetical protein NTW21_39260 [Verrucomicrobia bacterium]|nr:hypothetical protein [Verrucomicrobiota bacterium]
MLTGDICSSNVVYLQAALIIAMAGLLCGGLAGTGWSAVDPANLRCEHLENPLGIDVAKPRLSWVIPDLKFESSNLESSLPRGVWQTAYQVLVASSEKILAADRGDLWDSGKVDAEKSACIEYAGEALSPATRYWWKVRVWDQAGKSSGFSTPARFDTGLGPKDWTARFIWDGTDNLNNFAYFRKAFVVTGKPSMAKVYVTAHNDIYAMCVRSASQNVQPGMISTDANREQSPWTTDGWHIGNVLLYNHHGTTIIDKVVHDYAAEQRPNGDFFACSPAECFGSPEWSMYWPMLLWQQYLFAGDEVLLRGMAPRLIRFLNCLKPSQDPKTKLQNPPGWRISEWAGGDMPSEGLNITTTCLYYENLRIAARVFDVLKQADVSNDYLRQAEEVKAGVNAHLFNGEFYRVRTDRQEMYPVASAWPLRFDMVPPALKARVVATIEKAGTPDFGAYGAETFYAGLLNAGGSDFVIGDLARYKSMLAENKTNWERFVFGEDEVNHAWTSFPGAHFLKYIAGIQPTSGGFATFDVRPATGGLAFAEGTVPTIKGPIATRWEKGAGGRFALSVSVPPNTRATVCMPMLVPGKIRITESGKLLWPLESAVKIPGVLAVKCDDPFIRCEVGSGTYSFVALPQEN